MRWALASVVLVPRGTWGKPPTSRERRRVFQWASRAGFSGIELSPRWFDSVWWHIKNYRDGRPVPVWDGDIDYHWALAIMHGVGYEGWVSIESYWGDLESQEQDLEYLKRLDAISGRVTEG